MGFFDRLRRLVPGRAPTESFARGTHALERGRLELAEAAFGQALAAAERPAQVALVHNKLALVARGRGDRAGTIAALVAALEADPRSAAADGDRDEAVVHYEYAILVDEGYGPAYHNLGVAFHRAGRRREAVRMLRKASRLEGRMRRL